MNVKFKRTIAGTCNIVLNDLTQGEALALCNALNQYGQSSAVGKDVKHSVLNAIQRDGKTDQDQSLYSTITANW